MERTDWTGDEAAWTAACTPAAPHMLLLSPLTDVPEVLWGDHAD
jgi:hypothetical protein